MSKRIDSADHHGAEGPPPSATAWQESAMARRMAAVSSIMVVPLVAP